MIKFGARKTEKSEKDKINGKSVTDYLKTDAQIILYDVSLRASDDFEISGTH